MTLLKHALKNLRKDVIVQALTALQLAAALIIGVVMSSSVMMRYRYYKPFGDVIGKEGLYIHSQGVMPFKQELTDKLGDWGFVTPENLRILYPEIDAIVSGRSSMIGVDTINGESIFDEDGNSETGFSYLLYDEEITGRYAPELEEGRWFDPDAAEAVVTANDGSLNVGDTVSIWNWFCDGSDPSIHEYIDVKIVGKVRENQKVFGYWGYTNDYTESPDIRYVYGETRILDSYYPALIMPTEYFSQNEGIVPYISGSTFITFKSGVSPERCEEIRKELPRLVERSQNMTVCTLEEFRSRSLSYIFAEIKTLLPIIAVLLILVMISSISSSALAARRDMKTHAVFYITGLQWKQCSFISVIQSAIISVISLAFAGVSLGVMTNMETGMRVFFTPETFICVPAVLLFYVLVSLIMPLLIHFRTTPKEILAR